ncbi:saccharopine dehydrogenase [Phycomyces nitens]|nr:saccharopine dehydrogenase [Phycomyces nitens]
MSKQYDITVFGATGLTGKRIVDHIYELSTSQPTAFPSTFQWAVGGRDHEKLENVIDSISQKYPNSSLSRPSIIVANVVRRESVDEMTRQSKMVINAVGPFRYMGEYVVRSCVDEGCDYIDVSAKLTLDLGEPEFIERMQRTYHDTAIKKNVTIVHSCGFDSVPADMGVLKLKQLYAANEWTPIHIEGFMKIHAGSSGLRMGYATYESAVSGVGSVELLREIRKVSDLPQLPRQSGPRLKFRKGLRKDKEYGYHVPFLFADPSIVRLSQQLFLAGQAAPPNLPNDAKMPPTVQFAEYLLLPSFWICVLYYFYTTIFGLLASSPWGRNVLLNNPERYTHGLASKQDPTQEQLDETSFELILRSKGYSSQTLPSQDEPLDQAITLTVHGPEPGYVSTPRIALQCAFTLLRGKEAGQVPFGVLTPSTAFWNTDLIDRLCSVGITFDQAPLDTNTQ